MLGLRFRKLVFSLTRPTCWHALRFGVAASLEHMPLLRQLQVDGVIDVGANRGQFTLACRICHAHAPVVAFEPIPQEAQVFRAVHGNSEQVTLKETALGRESGKATLHLSNSADSSSLLPIGERQTEIFPTTKEVGEFVVSVSTLDSYKVLWQGRKKQLLKVDVQGFELEVLAGAVETLGTCRHVYCECSEVELYKGQALRSEVSQFLCECGFIEQGRYNAQFDKGQLIQADYLFARSGKS